MLARWRERDVFHETLRRREGAAAVGLLRGPADRQRPARLAPRPRARLQGHLPALQDDARLLRRRARPAGTATACRSSSRSSSSSASRPSTRSRPTASPSSTRSAASRSSRTSRSGTRLTERIGFWIDLDDAYRTLDDDVHRVGLVGAAPDLGQGPALRGPQGRPLLPALRHGAVLPRGGAGLPGRRSTRRVYVRFPVAEDGRPAAGGRRAAGVDDDAVDAGLERRGRGRPRARRTCARGRADEAPCRARRGAASSACSATGVADPRRFPGAALDGAALRAAVPASSPADEYGERGHTVLLGRLRHRRRRHRPRAHRDRLRRGRLPPRRAVRAERRQPGAAGRHLRRAHRPVRGPLREGRRPRPDRGPRARGRLLPRRGRTSTPTRTAGAAARRCSTTPSRRWYIRTTAAPRRAARRERDGRLAPAAHQARALRQVAARTTSTGRCRASATGARRCRCGAASDGPRALHRLVRRAARSSAGVRLEDPHRPVRRRRRLPVPAVRRRDAARARGDRRLVRLGRDAVRAVPRAVRERGALRASASRPTSSARRSTRRAAGSTRCWPIATLLFDRSPLRERRLPRA